MKWVDADKMEPVFSESEVAIEEVNMTRNQKEVKNTEDGMVSNYQSLSYFSNQDLVKELQSRIKKERVLTSELDNLPNNLGEVSSLFFLKELSERVNKEGTLFFIYTEEERKIIAEWLKLAELDEKDKLCCFCHKKEILKGEVLFCPNCWEVEKKKRISYSKVINKQN